MENEVKNAFKDLRFNITEEMYNTMLQMLILHQMLEENNPTKKEQRLLEKRLKKLQYHFTYELQLHNSLQIEIFRKFIGK